MTNTHALDLASTFVVVDADHSFIPIAVSPKVFEELDDRFGHFKGRLLVSSFIFDTDWSTWELHPEGDEVVCLLAGEVTLILERNGVQEAMHLRDPGAFAIVPKGTWHTARTRVPTKMLFITPGEGTQNKPV